MSGRNRYELIFNLSLPDSGSMLLQTILAQNPVFFAPGPTPFLKTFDAMRVAYWSDFKTPELVTGITETAFLSAARGFAETFFVSAGKKIVIDTGDLLFLSLRELIKKVTGGTKFIVVVRNPQQIVCSRLSRSSKGKELGGGSNLPVPEIADYFSHPRVETGLAAILSCVAEGIPADVFIVRYEDLCFSPRATLRTLYDFLERPFFEHTFGNLTPHKAGTLFFGITSSAPIEGRLESEPYDHNRILGSNLALEIMINFRQFFKEFYPELLTANPAHLVTSEEAKALKRKKEA